VGLLQEIDMTPMQRPVPIALAAMLALGTGLAAAQSNPPPTDSNPMQDAPGTTMPASPAWNDVDANSDGYISKDELASYPTYQRDFEQHDTDGDGRISPTEWSTWQQTLHPGSGG
jgi:hypothetical protein